MFFLVFIDEGCVTDSEVLLDCVLSEFTSTVPALVWDFIKSMMTVINPIRLIKKATPKKIAEMRTDLHAHSVLPIIQ